MYCSCAIIDNLRMHVYKFLMDTLNLRRHVVLLALLLLSAIAVAGVIISVTGHSPPHIF